MHSCIQSQPVLPSCMTLLEKAIQRMGQKLTYTWKIRGVQGKLSELLKTNLGNFIGFDLAIAPISDSSVGSDYFAATYGELRCNKIKFFKLILTNICVPKTWEKLTSADMIASNVEVVGDEKFLQIFYNLQLSTHWSSLIFATESMTEFTAFLSILGTHPGQ